MKITTPELKVVRFANEDVIATSLYYAPAAAFNATQGTGFASNYVQFEGSMTSFDPDQNAWLISNIHSAEATDDDTMNALKSGGWIYLPEVGITIPSTAMAPIAQQAYDSYSYNDSLYTKGATYYETYWQ